jgi:hypothetical protein
MEIEFFEKQILFYEIYPPLETKDFMLLKKLMRKYNTY